MRIPAALFTLLLLGAVTARAGDSDSMQQCHAEITSIVPGAPGELVIHGSFVAGQDCTVQLAGLGLIGPAVVSD